MQPASCKQVETWKVFLIAIILAHSKCCYLQFLRVSLKCLKLLLVSLLCRVAAVWSRLGAYQHCVGNILADKDGDWGRSSADLHRTAELWFWGCSRTSNAPVHRLFAVISIFPYSAIPKIFMSHCFFRLCGPSVILQGTVQCAGTMCWTATSFHHY